jgi:hypothetical protein
MKVFNLALAILHPIRVFLVVMICALIFLTSAFPALAITSYQSDPTEGTTQLLETQRKTDEVSRSGPPKLREVQEKSNKGFNEVQGDADIDKMKSPENSQSSTSVRDEVEDFLGKVTGNK